jgi:hypothetical protein
MKLNEYIKQYYSTRRSVKYRFIKLVEENLKEMCQVLSVDIKQQVFILEQYYIIMILIIHEPRNILGSM